MEINKTYNEDCLITMGNMLNEFVDLTITSPPYDEIRNYNKGVGKITDDLNGYSFEFEKIARELYRVTKKGGVVVWIVNDSIIKGSESLNSFRQALFFKEI
jgi:site-specific DNA-methyltransferase (adenine-specific)